MPGSRRPATASLAARAALALVPLLLAAPAEGRPPVDVTVDVFSGRPNPTFTLSDPAEVAEVQSRLTSLIPGALVREAAGLGYRGFLLGGIPGVAGAARVYHGRISTDRSYIDDRDLEGYLLARARAVLGPGLLPERPLAARLEYVDRNVRVVIRNGGTLPARVSWFLVSSPSLSLIVIDDHNERVPPVPPPLPPANEAGWQLRQIAPGQEVSTVIVLDSAFSPALSGHYRARIEVEALPAWPADVQDYLASPWVEIRH